ncbi:uncharacterized protein LOC143289302 [Babylonia areolata]|uniref:uncharacterized protein LOC143289302 n=1 Tax=Babylonia areolata TaxID=304850 RepID=UPI003FD1939D
MSHYDHLNTRGRTQENIVPEVSPEPEPSLERPPVWNVKAGVGGENCRQDIQCLSHTCKHFRDQNGKVCASRPCRQEGDVCTYDYECCGENCTHTSDNRMGACVGSFYPCRKIRDICEHDYQCCSDNCHLMIDNNLGLCDLA